MSSSFVLVLLLLTVLHLATCEYKLQLLDRLFLPSGYRDAEQLPPIFEYGQAAVKGLAYDIPGNSIYVVGRSHIHVVNALSPYFLKNRYHETVAGYTLTDVNFCGQYVIVSGESLTDRNDGIVRVYEKFNAVDISMKLLHTIQLNALPNMVAITSDCRTILVAIEGKPYMEDNELIDPEGAVHLIHFSTGDLSQSFAERTLDFKSFDAAVYEPLGVRFIYKENSNTFAQDLEPEFISINEDNTMAYVSLQENNAIATVSIANFQSAAILDLIPLGTKQWRDSKFDASDVDEGIDLRDWNVRGIYQPDHIKFFQVDNNPYLLLLNEGDAKVYETFSEVKRGQEFVLEDLVHESVDPVLRDQLLATTNLGRLKFTNIDGKSGGSDKFSQFYAFGSRGFTIRSVAPNLPIVYDSGSSLEDSMSQHLPDLFNTDGMSSQNTVNQTHDRQSPERGPECESGDVGVIGQDTLLFIGSEKAGTISIYSIVHDVQNPVFHSIQYGGNLTTTDTWEYQYDVRRIGDIDPEGIQFVSGRDSPLLGEELLIVTSVASGSIAIYKVVNEDSPFVPERLLVEVRRLFDLADMGRNEFVDKAEFRIFIMLSADLNEDGMVTPSEFEFDWLNNKNVPFNEQGSPRVFNALDVDNDGFIEPADCDNFVSTITDADGNDMLTIDEWTREWRRLLENGVDWE